MVGVRMSEQDHRDIRYIMTVVGILVALGLCLACSRVDAAELPNGITCEHVTRAVSTLGKTQAYLIAVANGATRAQMAEARKCLTADRRK